MDPPNLPTFEEVDRQIRAAVKRALEVTAQRAGLAADLQLFDRALDSPASTDGEVRQYFMGSPPLALVDFDTPGIQDYVFSSQRPIDLAGGSALIGDLTRDGEGCETSIFRRFRQSKLLLPAEVVIYGGGGGGLLLVAAVEAEEVCGAIETILATKTYGALKSVASCVSLWPIDLSPQPASIPDELGRLFGPQRAVSRYGASIIALEAKLGRQRSQRLDLAQVIDSKNDHERCHVCSERSWSKKRTSGEEEEKVCSSCHARWVYGIRSKRGGEGEEEQPWTFDEMFEDLPRRDLAVIYADGANVGKAFQLLDRPQRHRALSLAVDDAMERMVDAVRALCKEQTGIDKNLVLSPVLGGDDVVLVLPGMVAQQAVGKMIEVFEGAFDLKSNALLRGAFGQDADGIIAQRIRRFGLGVGLAVGRGQFPVHFLLDYARQLLKSSKAEIRRRAPEVRSAVDFMILSSGAPVSHDVDEVRESYLQRQARHGDKALRFTRRPYAATEFAALVHKAELLERHVDRSQVHLMRQEVWRGHALSRNLWRYQHARAKEDQGWDAFRRASKCALGSVDSLLWQVEGDAGSESVGDDVLTTDYLDVCELLSLRGSNVLSEDLNQTGEGGQ